MQSGTTGSLGGSSFGVQTAQLSFDVKKESEVIALLKHIHQNPIDPEVKNSIRDAVFAYRQDFSSASFDTLKNICTTVGIALASDASPESLVSKIELVTTRFNSGRPLPAFAVVSAKAEPTPAAQPNTGGVNPVPFRKIVVPTFDAPKVTPPAPPKPVEPVVVPEPVVTQVVEAPAVAFDVALAQARISEIKHTVNAKVGNPVNLIDSHNEVGRTYMNALLDAMKKVNGGTYGESAAAMSALEAAYASVQSVLDGAPMSAQSVPSTPVPKPAATPTPAPVASMPEDVTPTKQVADAAKVAAIEAKLLELKNRMDQVKQTPKPVPQQAAPQVAPVPTPAYTAPEVVRTAPVESVRRSAVATSPDSGMHSVAKNKQLQDLLRSNREKEITTEENKQKEEIAKMDPIMTPEVTAGLSQLLSEWGLFRSSGFFGTGPSGKDHALYQKLAPLTMASVIAGRFEGATPLIKQSIGDYMNGWRYEEGIVHEHGETFEHYLRKVVYHIIEKKKKAILKK